MKAVLTCVLLAVVSLLMAGTCVAFADDAIDAQLEKIKSIGREGEGNVAAAKAIRLITSKGPEVLPAVLKALNGANPIAANYLRALVDSIAERTLKEGEKLPKEQLESFVLDTKNGGPARRVAYEWLVKVDPSAPKRLLPKMVNDPGQELRRDAIKVRLQKADKLFEAKKKTAALKAYQRIFKAARDRDQVTHIARRIKELGGDGINLTRHFGFITQWDLVAPFDSSDGKGFHKVYAPEKGVDLQATYQGKDGKKIQWKKHKSDFELGNVDLNQVFGDLHDVVAYAHATVVSPKKRPVEIRASSKNAIQIFLNGTPIFSREEYHHGMRMDQHVGRGTLKKGRNEILVKICQNNQTESWAQLWSFQLRVCDSLGAAVPIKVE